MRCRNIVKNDDGTNQIVWFGKVFNNDGTVKSSNENSYDKDGKSVENSLTQKLSIIRGELWTNIAFGLPLLDKPTKPIVDAEVLRIINNTNGIIKIIEFDSRVENRHYYATIKILSKYGEFEISI